MSVDPSALFAALGQTHRLAIFRLLARRAPEGVPASEIAEAVGVRPNNASVHLAQLARAGLIRGERAGKLIRYRLDLAAAGGLIDYLALDCCRGRPELCAAAARRLDCSGEDVMTGKTYTLLFICSGNSARSIFAEAILNREGAGRFVAHSAGTRPRSELNPYAVAQLEKLGHDVSGLRAKHVSEFQGEGAPHFDFVFTVCDKAANEDCAPWPGRTITGHWGVPDPVAATGTEAERAYAFAEAYRMLKHRIGAFVALPFDKLDRIATQKAVDAIGRSETASV
jgi:arsenate reductase